MVFLAAPRSPSTASASLWFVRVSFSHPAFTAVAVELLVVMEKQSNRTLLRGRPEVLLRMLMLHVARGYSLRETVVHAKLANWTDISDVALLKRLRNSEEWLRWLCIELLRENVAYRLEGATSHAIRIVDGTIVREPGKTGSQWRILYSIRLPSLVCDFFEVTATIGEGSGESLNRLPVGPHELILADAGYCSVAALALSMFGNMVLMCWFASTLRVSWRTLHTVDASPSCRDYALCPKWGSSANGGLSFMVEVRRLRAGCVQYERATARFNRHIGDYCAKRVRSK
jgi:hypothetical protein